MEHNIGPFSAIRLQELSLLANRDKSVMRRYGKKNVERVFETQLALVLVMQSFGLYVVSTRTGQSTVDLVCISASPEERVTFLLEAKTTKATYALPKTDFRALQYYVNTVRRSLSTLPPLSFCLIVGSKASKTLGGKLAALEAEASVPVESAGQGGSKPPAREAPGDFVGGYSCPLPSPTRTKGAQKMGWA